MSEAENKMTRRQRASEKRLELTLAQLRKSAEVTQVELATRMGTSQAEVSKIESRESVEPLQVSTLRRIVEALGGELELVARMPNGAPVIVKSG